MTMSANVSVTIQTSAHSAPSPPVWFGELTMLAQCLHQQGVLAAICEQVRFARRRFGRYEVIDFVAVLFGYAISGERTLETFYERLHPFATAFMALFGRDRLPSRSALSRWLAALDQAAVESLRSLFLSDLLAHRLADEEPLGGLWDRMGSQLHAGNSSIQGQRGSTVLASSSADGRSGQRSPALTLGQSLRERGVRLTSRTDSHKSGRAPGRPR